MKAEEILKTISDHPDDYEFEFEGKKGAICIFDNEIIAGYDGSENTFDTLAEVMTAPFINGKSLNEVADKIVLYG